jgi:hypothetical protein
MHTPAVTALTCILLGSITGNGHAQEVTAQQLLELCSPQASDAGHGICLGYIIGSLDTSVVRGGMCPPPSLTHGQVRDTVLEFMRKHPERLQEPAPHLIVAAMAEAFPCR